MSKRAFFSVVFIALSLGIALFVANEYLKRIEIGAINSYLATLQRELGEKHITLDFSQTQCAGFLKHTCQIDRIALDSTTANNSTASNNSADSSADSIDNDSTIPPLLQNKQIVFKNIRLAITDLNTREIALSVSIGAISHNLIFLPRNFAYALRLHKQDSALGYVMLDRTLKLDVGNVAISVDFAVLMRERRLRDKSIFFLLKEWLDPTTPSFYEYSLERLDISIEARDAVHSAFYTANRAHLERLSDELNITNPHFEALKNATLRLMQNEISRIDFSVRRKRANLVFFHTLEDSATTKKALEIKEILESINDSYEIKMAVK